MHRALQGKHLNRSSTQSMARSIVCTVSLPHRQILWVHFPSLMTFTNILTTPSVREMSHMVPFVPTHSPQQGSNHHHSPPKHSSIVRYYLSFHLLPMLPLIFSPAIPTEQNGGNHTRAFTLSAASKEAHIACLNISKALALTGLRVLMDDKLAQQVINRYLLSSTPTPH